VVKRQQGELIRDLIKQKCDEINKEIESVGNLHLFTPSPKARPLYVPRQFEVDKPRSPILQKPGLFSSLFKSLRDKIEDLNRVSLAIYDHQLKGWKVQFAAFQEYERRRKELIETKIYSELPAMQQFLDDTLQGIVWPRETLAFSKIYAEGRVVFIEVDLPEIENMPNKMASIPSKGYKLTVKELSSANIHKLYMQHVHAIAFRTIGEAFRSLPKAQMIILSAFSHRPDKTNGRITKDYLLSVRVLRKSWGA